MNCKLDLALLKKGIAHKRAVSKRALAEIENKAGRNICLRAVQFTERAQKSEIRGQLNNGLALKLVQSRKFDHRLPRKLQGFSAGKHTKSEIDAAAKQLVATRVRSVANIAAGWIKAARVFGAALNRKVSDKGNTGKGYGGKATATHLVAFGVNMANGAAKMGFNGLQRAVDFVGTDMLGYAPKVLKNAVK